MGKCQGQARPVFVVARDSGKGLPAADRTSEKRRDLAEFSALRPRNRLEIESYAGISIAESARGRGT